jgi:hypothetical protein
MVSPWPRCQASWTTTVRATLITCSSTLSSHRRSSRRFGGKGIEQRLMAGMHVLHVAQPEVGESDALVVERGVHTAAAVMADDHDVLDLEHIDGELDHREAVEVGVHHDVGDIAMDEDLARQQADDLVGRHARIGAADPQVFRRLQVRQLSK